MEILHRAICEHLPSALSKVPIPSSIGGFFKLSVSEWLSLCTFGGLSGLIGYSIYTTARLHYSAATGTKVNLDIKKEEAKVVDTVDVEDIGKKGVFCRCWRSKKFPYCDGSHAKHNELTGDNVGPLIIKANE